MSEPETTEKHNSTWHCLRREKWTEKTELSSWNGQTHSCSAQDQPVSYAQTVAFIKSVNVKRHYETKHKVFDQTYPLRSELRSQKIRSLRAQFQQSTPTLTHSFKAQQRVNECSPFFSLKREDSIICLYNYMLNDNVF